MAEKIGKYTVLLNNRPIILSSASIVGKSEGEGPLYKEWDEIVEDAMFGMENWEKAESELQRRTIRKAIDKSGVKKENIDAVFAGDLLNQCVGSTFGARELNIPFIGMYGACSTMALTLAAASVFVDSGAFKNAVAATSSHFCSAEKQFRYPLEYGGQRPPTAQRTATASGAMVIADGVGAVGVEAVTFGRIRDLGVKDAGNMGAAMAPAAADTIFNFLTDTSTKPEDYDIILTGDLGEVGSSLLYQILEKDYKTDIRKVHRDCGLMIYDRKNQDVNAGGSGCGCGASVLCSQIIRRLRDGEISKVLFCATGALMSTITSNEGESIPSISHGVLITSLKK